MDTTRLALWFIATSLGCGSGAALTTTASSTTGSSTSSTATTGGGGRASTSSTSSATGSGGAGGAPECTAATCKGPGEACVSGACVSDCRRAQAQPCGPGKECDASEANPGNCVAPGSSCLTTSTPEPCGSLVCGPGSACDAKGACYPRVPCATTACDAKGCWGASCACTRAAGCAPAPVGTPGEKGTLQDDAFRHGLVDLQFDPTCGAWGVTLVSGPDYLRSIAPAGSVKSLSGVTNLNMGEVSVLRVPADVMTPTLDVALTYICCATCGCELNSTPQGVAHFDQANTTIPLVIPSKTFTTGKGPFGEVTTDTGPAGLSYGTDHVLYVGNVNLNGDYYKLDLATKVQTLVTTFPARVYASTPYDSINMLVAFEGGEVRLLRLTDGTSMTWAMSSSPVVGMVRDFFDGAVYVARRDNAIWKYDAPLGGAIWQTAANPSRIAVAPDGYLYALQITPPFSDQMPTVARWLLPTTR